MSSFQTFTSAFAETPSNVLPEERVMEFEEAVTKPLFRVLPAWESSSWDNSSSSSSVVSLRVDFIFANLKFQCSSSKVVSMEVRSAHQMNLNLACP